MRRINACMAIAGAVLLAASANAGPRCAEVTGGGRTDPNWVEAISATGRLCDDGSVRGQMEFRRLPNSPYPEAIVHAPVECMRFVGNRVLLAGPARIIRDDGNVFPGDRNWLVFVIEDAGPGGTDGMWAATRTEAQARSMCAGGALPASNRTLENGNFTVHSN